ncbi:MAG: N-acetylmuramoyl-L-alanine amidase [Leptolyngbyaceae bacterium]|nr:N-acetylmuramoyl-L-alanine amidase [Leptolyngbyaceae bacterium]
MTRVTPDGTLQKLKRSPPANHRALDRMAIGQRGHIMPSIEINQEQYASTQNVKPSRSDARPGASRSKANSLRHSQGGNTMKKMMRTVSSALLTAAGVGLVGLWDAPGAIAAFSNRPIPENDVIATASPIGSTSHQLIILEQLSNERECWRQTGETVDPLILNFDFVGICGRATGSNGTSLLVDGEDLGWRYSIRVQEQGETLKLTAQSSSDRTAPVLEIGTAQKIDGELVKISLNPGWSITKRIYNGEPVLHYYLTNDRPLDDLLEEARELLPRVPSSNPRTPTRPSSPTQTPSAGNSGQSGAPERPTTSPSPIPTTRPLPNPTQPTTPSRPTLPPPPSPSIQGSGLNYRVIALVNTEEGRQRVRALVPDAFPTTIEGVSVMQAGAFNQLAEAEVMRQRLRIYGIEGRTINIPPSGGTTSTPRPSTGTPSIPTTPQPRVPSRQPSTQPTLPSVPNGRYVVVIDPGHGGRDPGAIGIGGLREVTVVEDISRQVISLLQQRGIQVVVTRNMGQFVDLAPRVSVAERVDADIFVSIHANAISLSRPEVNGAETYYYSSAEGRRLAQTIHQSILQRTGIGDRGVREARFYVLRNTSMPSVLVETGFVTGAQDARRLNDPTFRTRMAEAIAIGILNYLQ